MQAPSPEQLQKLAGATAFAAGEALFAAAAVSDLTIGETRITANVRDGGVERVELRVSRRQVDPSCTCPDSDGFDFCKHCAAVGLAAHAQLERQAALRDGSEAERIEAYLLTQPRESLISSLVQASQHDSALRRQLLLRADVAAGKASATRLKRDITAATPLRDTRKAREIKAYYETLERALAELEAIAAELPAKTLKSVVDHAIERLGKALDRVYDRKGERNDSMAMVRALIRRVLEHQELPESQRVAFLLQHVIADDKQLLPLARVFELLASSLGDSGVETLVDLARAHFDTVTPPELGEWRYFDSKEKRVEALLLHRYEATGDDDNLLHVLQRRCMTAADCYRVAELLITMQRLDEAETWLTRGDEAMGPRAKPTTAHVRLLRARDDHTGALNAQRALLLNRPTLEALLELKRLAQSADHDPAGAEFWRDTLDALLHRARTDPMFGHAAAWTLARYAASNGDLERAFVLVRDHLGNDDDHRLEALEWFGDDPERALSILDRVIDNAIDMRTRHAYQYAAGLLQSNRALFDALSERAYHDKLLALRVRYGRRSGLIAQLERIE
ncbi:MAG: SWIM zinc finger family protein [Pseudomonadota bacterium]